MSINKVTITGNLTRDMELRQTASGFSIGSFGVAVNERRKDQSGQWGDYANFFDCTMMGTRAEKLGQYLTKGTKVAIEGRLHWSQWESNGQKRSKVEIIVDNVEFMSRSEQAAPAYAPAPAPAPAYADMYDEEVPF